MPTTRSEFTLSATDARLIDDARGTADGTMKSHTFAKDANVRAPGMGDPSAFKKVTLEDVAIAR